jgi:hypothetical protein
MSCNWSKDRLQLCVVQVPFSPRWHHQPPEQSERIHPFQFFVDCCASEANMQSPAKLPQTPHGHRIPSPVAMMLLCAWRESGFAQALCLVLTSSLVDLTCLQKSAFGWLRALLRCEYATQQPARVKATEGSTPPLEVVRDLTGEVKVNKMAPAAGFEPATNWLTANCATAALRRSRHKLA